MLHGIAIGIGMVCGLFVMMGLCVVTVAIYAWYMKNCYKG